MLTIRDPKSVEGRAIGVSYDAFVDDVQVRAARAQRCPVPHAAFHSHAAALPVDWTQPR